MIEIKTAFPLDDKIKHRYLLEEDFSLNYSVKHRIYYNAIRPVMPVPLRQMLQRRFFSGKSYNANFIREDFVLEVEKRQNGMMPGADHGMPPENLYKNQSECAVVLSHDVEDAEGFAYIPKVLALEEKYGFKSSWNIVPYKYPIDRGIINEINGCGHEIGIHGYNHDGKLYTSGKIFRERVPYINRALEEYGAVGFRSPLVHRNLLWLQLLNIEYDASCFDYDPFQPMPGGTGSIWPFIAGKFTELPYTLPQDHTLFYVLNQKDITIWKNKVDWIVQHKGVILTLTHPDYLIPTGHFEMYEELLQYLKSITGAWYCLPKELARHWKTLCG